LDYLLLERAGAERNHDSTTGGEWLEEARRLEQQLRDWLLANGVFKLEILHKRFKKHCRP
jgi:hypothetical protein